MGNIRSPFSTGVCGVVDAAMDKPSIFISCLFWKPYVGLFLCRCALAGMKNRDKVSDLIHEMSCATATSVRHLQPAQATMAASKKGSEECEDAALSPPIVFWGQNQLVIVEQGPKTGRAKAKFAFLR